MAKYLRLDISNTENMRFTDRAGSQSGQTATFDYIPGSSLRGAFITYMCMGEDFEQKKLSMFKNLKFYNAYPKFSDKELIPSIKGFYEDKSEAKVKDIENVLVKEEVTGGYKRASLGRYCNIENGKIFYTTIKEGAELKIKINSSNKEKNNLFRNDYIEKGQSFLGYVQIEDEELVSDVEKFFNGEIIIGNSRTAGMGKCGVKVTELGDGEVPYSYIMDWDGNEVKNEVYLVLLAPTVMRNENGEFCGLDENKIGKLLGVSNVNIERCATSVRKLSGYNRVWKAQTMAVPVYEQGSVFRLSFDGDISKEKALEAMAKGIGIRVSEGYGRFVLLQHYEKLSKKESMGRNISSVIDSNTNLSEEDKKVLKQIARNYYRQKINDKMPEALKKRVNKGKLKNSQLGAVDARLMNNRYDYEAAMKVLDVYFGHAKEKEDSYKVHKEKASVSPFYNQVTEIKQMDRKSFEKFVLGENDNFTDKDTVMGIPKSELLTKDELGQLKLDFLSKMIRMEYKRVKA